MLESRVPAKQNKTILTMKDNVRKLYPFGSCVLISIHMPSQKVQMRPRKEVETILFYQISFFPRVK